MKEKIEKEIERLAGEIEKGKGMIEQYQTNTNTLIQQVNACIAAKTALEQLLVEPPVETPPPVSKKRK